MEKKKKIKIVGAIIEEFTLEETFWMDDEK